MARKKVSYVEEIDGNQAGFEVRFDVRGIDKVTVEVRDVNATWAGSAGVGEWQTSVDGGTKWNLAGFINVNDGTFTAAPAVQTSLPYVCREIPVFAAQLIRFTNNCISATGAAATGRLRICVYGEGEYDSGAATNPSPVARAGFPDSGGWQPGIPAIK